MAHPAPGDYKDVILFLATAGIIVPLFRRWKISPILGFLGAGVLLGPLHGDGLSQSDCPSEPDPEHASTDMDARSPRPMNPGKRSSPRSMARPGQPKKRANPNPTPRRGSGGS